MATPSYPDVFKWPDGSIVQEKYWVNGNRRNKHYSTHFIHGEIDNHDGYVVKSFPPKKFGIICMKKLS